MNMRFSVSGATEVSLRGPDRRRHGQPLARTPKRRLLAGGAAAAAAMVALAIASPPLFGIVMAIVAATLALATAVCLYAMNHTLDL